ncbi:MAG: hypothetical protein GX277_03270 [Bacteroidales bacterium]|jgi:uncharacterized protein YhbP (UPF0306 family)|nr:hypothetical protein [Bacteroidales bacterium]
MTNPQSPLDARIQAFIKEHHVLTLATSQNSIPWCAHCFYVFDTEYNCFYIVSDEHTRHVQEMIENPQVAGAIALETKNVGRLQGLQFSGTIKKLEGKEKQQARKIYIVRFPYAILTNTIVWKIEMTFAKFTDNTLGFGKKLIWE